MKYNFSNGYILSNLNGNSIEISIFNGNKTKTHTTIKKLGFWNNTPFKVELSKYLSEPETHEFFDKFKNQYELKQVPEGFDIDDNGLYSTTADAQGIEFKKFISFTPTWISKKYYNPDADTTMLDVSFYTAQDIITTVTLPQKEVMQRRGIMEIAAHGALLEESLANRMINWIANYVRYNDIPAEEVYERFGWKENNKFLIGNSLYYKDQVDNVKIINVPKRSIDGLKSKGGIDKWVDMSRKILKYDNARFKCYASCVPPLLKLLNQKSIILHDYGESSTGKTKTSELAMSIWGDPTKLIMSGFSTAVGKERLATIFTDMPILIDETQVATEEENTKFVYMIANETGKLRGKKDGGLDDTQSWKTLAFTTGEAPLTTEKSFMGMSARVLEIYGGLGAHDSDAIDDFKSGVENCYGVFAPLLINEIFDNLDILDENYMKLYKTYMGLTSGISKDINGIGGRSANMFAVISLAGVIFESILEEIGGDFKNPTDICLNIFKEYIYNMSDSGYAKRAYDYYKSWLASKEKYFYVEDMEISNRSPYDIYGSLEMEYTLVFPNILRDMFDKGGFNYSRVLKDWGNLGWIMKQNNKNSFVVKYSGKSKRVIKIKNDIEGMSCI